MCGLAEVDLSSSEVKSGPPVRLRLWHGDLSLSSESGVRRQFLKDNVQIAFTQEGKEFPECSSFSNILSSVRCERASDGLTASCFSLATSLLSLCKGRFQKN